MGYALQLIGPKARPVPRYGAGIQEEAWPLSIFMPWRAGGSRQGDSHAERLL